MGLSLSLFVWYNNEKTQKTLESLEADIDYVEQYDENEIVDEEHEDLTFENEEERIYVLKQLYVRQNKLRKQKRKSIILFNLCGFVLVILGFVGLF